MTGWRFVVRSLVYHRRIHLAVALAVAAAIAVLTGALFVGDSVRESLRQLTLDRLGRIEEVLVADRFFDEQRARDLTRSELFSRSFTSAVPAIVFPSATVERQGAGLAARASRVLVIGCDRSFWSLSGQPSQAPGLPGDGEIVLNAPLAEDLRVSVGDEVVVRLPKATLVPGDSPLADKSDRIRSLAGLKVAAVIPARGLGRFSLRASQNLPRNAYLSLQALQQAVKVDRRVNAIFIAGRERDRCADEASSRQLTSMLRPSLEDLGISIERVRRVFPAEGDPAQQVIYDYFSLSTDRMIFSSSAQTAIERTVASWEGQAVLTYLANSMEKVPARDEGPTPVAIPYSMVTAIDVSGHFRLSDVAGKPIEPLGEDEIVLNQWTARELGAQVGDRIRLRFFEPETVEGQARERGVEFKLKATTPLVRPAIPYVRQQPCVFREPPALANDPDLTPKVVGVTDQDSIDNWDPPFPFDYGRIRSQDEDYWAHFRTTPKAFVSLAAGQRLWGSRFGRVTSFRVPTASGVKEEVLRQALWDELSRDLASQGFEFQPIKRRQLEAAQGTTPFDLLFLALSFFVIAAALLLVTLLFRMGVERRASELGTLLAVGLHRRQVSWLFVAEGCCVAAAGGLLGLVVAVGYARLIVAGLQTWWVGAITTPFLAFHWTWQSLAIGYCSGVLACLATIVVSVRVLKRVAVRSLLAGQALMVGATYARRSRVLAAAAFLCLVSAAGLLVQAARLLGVAQAGAFVGGGALLLGGLLLAYWGRLRRGGAPLMPRRWSLSALAMRDAARNPGRSAATVGLMAAATFLIVSMSSFRLDPSARGTGGFDLVAESSEPIFEDLNQPDARQAWLADQASALSGGWIFGLRLRAGDDASCSNLFRPSQPRVIGVTDAFVDHFDGPQGQSFAWASHQARTDSTRRNPWRLLNLSRAPGDDAVPAVVDMNTAMYSLKPAAKLGGIYRAAFDSGSEVKFRIVAMLDNSVLQGALLIGETDFQRLFPEVSGYQYFLIQSPEGKSGRVASVLEDRLGDRGFDTVPASRLLEQLLAVQNTYLSTFQSLGALGLLLGTFGMAAVQMRNVFERRGELALLRAAGFRRSRLIQLVMCENILLLSVGLGTGLFSALLAVLPHKYFGEASIPLGLLRDLAVMLGVVFLAGVAASLASVRAALRAPLLAALRAE